jgi:hypothetical protein
LTVGWPIPVRAVSRQRVRIIILEVANLSDSSGINSAAFWYGTVQPGSVDAITNGLMLRSARLLLISSRLSIFKKEYECLPVGGFTTKDFLCNIADKIAMLQRKQLAIFTLDNFINQTVFIAIPCINKKKALELGSFYENIFSICNYHFGQKCVIIIELDSIKLLYKKH